MRTWRRREEGFTLLEVLAAVTILSVVSLAMTAFFIQAMGYAKGNENKTVAVNLARNALFFTEKQSFQAFKTYFIDQNHDSLTIADCQLPNPDSDYVNCTEDLDNNLDKNMAKKTLFNAAPNLYQVLSPEVNGRNYQITINYKPALLSSSKEDLKGYLIPIVITAWNAEQQKSGRNSAEVEGYIVDEKIR